MFAQSAVAVKEKFTFSVCRNCPRGISTPKSVTLEEIAVGPKFLGLADFLPLEDIDKYIGDDGSLRIDVWWGAPYSDDVPKMPVYEESFSFLPGNTLLHLRRWNLLRLDSDRFQKFSAASALITSCSSKVSYEVENAYEYFLPYA